MAIIKTLLFISLIYLAAGANDGLIPIGPGDSTTSTTSTDAPTTTPKPTTPTTPTTSKPTTPTTSKPTTPPTPKPTTPTTPKPTTPTTPKPTTPTTPKPTTPTTPKPTTPTTPKPTTPTTPKPTPAPSPIGTWSLNYTNSNKTCLTLEAELDIIFNYKDGNLPKNVTVKVPSTALPSGQCGDKVENLTLSFEIPNAVNFNFKKSKDGKKYEVDSIIVMLNLSLPGTNGSMPFILAHNTSEFSTPLTNSYKCAKEQNFSLISQTLDKSYNGVLTISHLQVQAFRNSSSTKFDEALDCVSYETPDIVPIAVGCALAVLVIIVLIAYLIGRRRSQARGYLSMFAQNKNEEDDIQMRNLSCFN